MTADSLDRLARTLLYEGYLLYPYTSGALKNRSRWTMGSIYPVACCEAGRDASGESSHVSTEILVACQGQGEVEGQLRFLQTVSPDGPGGCPEAVERTIPLPPVPIGEGSETRRSIRFDTPCERLLVRGSEVELKVLTGRLTVAVNQLEPVQAAVEPAVEVVCGLVQEWTAGGRCTNSD